MNDEQLQQIERIGANYSSMLTNLVDSMDDTEAQVQFLRLTFDAILIQLLNRRGPTETAKFLRRSAGRIEADMESRRLLQ